MSNADYLNAIAKDCMVQLDHIGIPYGNIRDFTINTRARRWGQCQRRPDGYHININHLLCDGNHEDGLRNTLYHEIIHTCDGCMNHKAKWKGYAAMVKDRLGYDITRTNSAESKGVDPADVKPRESVKYKFRCEGCGGVIRRRRASKFTRNYMYYRCGRCGGKLIKLEV